MSNTGTGGNSCAALALAGLLVACGSPAKDAAESDNPPEREPGIYRVDGETGEITARVTREDGSVAVMRSGENVPIELPDGFTIFPDAQVVSNTVVNHATGRAVVLVMRSEAEPGEVVEFYREQAASAAIETDIRMSAGGAEILAGKVADGRSISLTASREARLTTINLTLTETRG